MFARKRHTLWVLKVLATYLDIGLGDLLLGSVVTTSERMAKIERVQTGVRIERRLLKVLKALAEYLDLSLGDLIEGIVLHAFEGKAAFDSRTMEVIADLKKVYGLELSAADAHTLEECVSPPARPKRASRDR